MKRFSIILLALLSLISLASAGQKLTVASTMSPYDSGLYKVLIPKFEEKYDCQVSLFSVPTGQALKLLQGGNADVAVVHDRKAEDAVIRAGYGAGAWDVMYNDFVLVGPLDDPAGISKNPDSIPVEVGGIAQPCTTIQFQIPSDIKVALRKIKDTQVKFYSRSDMSGTHQKEVALWKAAGIDPVGSDWYRETGLGTVKVLVKSNQDMAYTIADRATWLSFNKDYPNLKIVCQNDQLMLNYIRIIPGVPAKYPFINSAMAQKFVEYMTSPEAQEMIRTFGVDKYGEPLYVPNAKTNNQ